jgi:hypothetical protein
MSKLAKLFLTLGLVAVVGVAAIVGAAWYWWKKNGTEFVETTKAAMDEGHESGRQLKESECLDLAVEKHKAEASDTFNGAVRNSLWLTACLEASQPQQKFCADVPAETEFIKLSIWVSQSCSQRNLSDPYCQTLFQNVAKYCSSPERAEKLRSARD